jgi:hypothetical protein
VTNPPDRGSIGVIVCTVCGAENPIGSRFCERCGTRLPQIAREEPAADQPTGAVSLPPSTRGDATLTFERLPLDPFDEPPPAPAPAEEVVVAGPDAPANAEAPGSPEASRPATAEPADVPSFRNAATMAFELPNLPDPAPTTSQPLPPEARNAATMAFELPNLDPAPTPSPPTAPAQDEAGTAARPPASGSPSSGTGWDYQSWKPQSPAEQAATPSIDDSPGTTRRSVPVPEAAPASSSQSTPPTATPAQRPSGYQAMPPGWYGPPPGNTPPQPGTVTYPTPAPGVPPAQLGYPGPGGYQQAAQGAPYAPQAYGQAQAAAAIPAPGPYPAPATGNNNRTLWIVLGVLGGLLLLCALICVLVILIGAASAASAGPIATSVATATRP